MPSAATYTTRASNVTREMAYAAVAAAALVLASGPRAAEAQDSVPVYVREHYVRQDLMVPMRDGARLHTVVFTPRDSSIAYPILLTRTPYRPDAILHPLGPADTFALAGYIFAFQSVRGDTPVRRAIRGPPTASPDD